MNRTQLDHVGKLIDVLQEIEAETGLHIESVHGSSAANFEVRNGDGERVCLLSWVKLDADPESFGYVVAGAGT
jgi:hypothetical protein